MTYRTWNWGRLAFVASFALAAFAACGGSDETPDGLGGEGGADGAGGTGGTPSTTGGAPNSSGGGSSVAGASSGGGGGEGGASPLPPDGGIAICTSDEDCASTDQVCAGMRRICVDCVNGGDCAAGEVCLQNVCEARPVCEDSLDCPSVDLVCVMGEGPGPGPGQGICLECDSDLDCAEEESCANNVCVRGCASDKDCTPLGLLCDFEGGSCVECRDASRCSDGEYCDDGTCAEAVCSPGETVCAGDDVATCNMMGSGFGDLDQCFNGTCEVIDGEAGCVSDE